MHLLNSNNLLVSVSENNFMRVKSMFKGYALSSIVMQIIKYEDKPS